MEITEKNKNNSESNKLPRQENIIENKTKNKSIQRKKWFWPVVSVVVLLIVAAVVAIVLQHDRIVNLPKMEFDPNEMQRSSAVEASALPAFTEEEINQLRTELAEAHAALEKANAESQDVAALVSEKNKLLDELAAKEVELKLKTPPVLDFKKILGMYEGYGELVTLTYNYEVTVETKTEGTFLGAQNKTLLYSIPGTLKIGVNFDKVKNGIVADDTKKTATVKIPAAYFISNEIDEGNVKRYDVSRGVFSKVEDKDYLHVAVAAKEKAQEQVTSNGMLPYAQRLAGLEFIGLLEPVTSKSGYQIIVEYDK